MMNVDGTDCLDVLHLLAPPPVDGDCRHGQLLESALLILQAFLELAKDAQYGFQVSEHSMTKMPVMFEKDPGDAEVRATVKCYLMSLPRAEK